MLNHFDPAVSSFCLLGLLWKEEVKDVGILSELLGLDKEDTVLTLGLDGMLPHDFLMEILELYLALSDASACLRSWVTSRSVMLPSDFASNLIGAV